MITKMTGVLTQVLDDEARLQLGAFEYQVLIPETVRMRLQLRKGQEVTLHIVEYLEGNAGGSRFVPRRIGFNTETELDFFELFCTVEKIGTKKALRAMARPVKDIADAISRQDVKWLSTLPGIGATTAEQIVTTLKRKVAPFVAVSSPAQPEVAAPSAVVEEKESKKTKANGKTKATESEQPATAVTTDDSAITGRLIEDVYEALMGLGHNPIEARTRLDDLLTCGKPFKTLQEAITLIYSQKG
ncbi:MAG: helix-hairpin-helix domain-containing protein [Planctomycetia bacterium]|nr:helix-hairpin-helix domain-containing protein [Planctomycetia bacterium]